MRVRSFFGGLCIVLIIFCCLLTTSCPSGLPGGSAIDKEFDKAALPSTEEGQNIQTLRFAGEYKTETSASPARSMLIFSDEFNSFDQAAWYALEEKTGQSGAHHVSISNDQLVISTTQTDRNPFLYSKAWAIPSSGLLRISRKVRVSYANDYFAGGFYLMQTNSEALQLSQDRKEEVLVGVMHLNFTYDPGRYPLTKGFVAITPDYKTTGNFAAIENAPFGQWVEEVLEYEPATGKARYILNGREYALTSKPADMPWFKVSMNAYGWYTGHKAEVDWIKIEVIQNSETQHASKTPGGFRTEDTLVSTTVQPSELPVTVAAGDKVSLTLPAYALQEPAVLTIEKLSVQGNVLAAWNVTCGAITQFEDHLEFTVPYPQTVFKDADKAKQIIAVSWNSKGQVWQQEYARFEKDKLVILLDHLTAVAIMPREDAPSSEYNTSLPEFLTRENFRDYVWTPFAEGHTWASQAGSFTNLLGEFPLMETLNTALENIGYVMSIVNIADKVINDDLKGASEEAVKAALSWAGSSVGTSAMTIASLGTFALEYSLNTFATAVLDADFRAFERAFRRANERFNQRSNEEWIQIITNILKKAQTVEQAKNMLDTALNHYTTKLWQDSGSTMYEEFIIYVSEEKGSQGFTYLGGLNEKNQRQMSENWKAELYPKLIPLFNIIAKREQVKLMNKKPVFDRQLKEQLGQRAQVKVLLKGLPQGYEVQAGFFRGQKGLSASRFQTDSTIVLTTPLSLFLDKGAPDSIAIRVRYSKNGKTMTKSWFQKFTLRRWNSEVLFDVSQLLAQDGTASGDTAEKTNLESGNDNEQQDKRGTEVASSQKITGSGYGGSWELVGDILTITRSEITTSSTKPENVVFSLRTDFDKFDSLYEGAEFISHSILEWSEYGPNAYGYMQHKLVEEIKFKVTRPDKPVYLFLWAEHNGSVSTWKAAIQVYK